MSNTNDPLTYEDAVKELEDIIAALKSPELSLDELQQKVHRAKQLVKFCRKRLRSLDEEAENIRQELSEDDID